MLFSQTTFLGIDPSAGQRPFVYAALDHDLNLLALGQGRLDDMLAFSAGQRTAVVGVCGPRQPNQKVMSRPEIRQALNPPPRPGRWVEFRLAEYELRQRRISVPQIPDRAEKAPNWMQMSFNLFSGLKNLGYQVYPNSEAACQMLEVYPFAAYTALLGVTPFPKYTLEGRLQRQTVLHDLRLKVSDPMRFFEEITRHKLLRGVLPTEQLLSAPELDALVAAYTAWQAALHPADIVLVGDPQEGQIVLPVAELRSQY
ncbi:MAG TPA: DUF429 domain-containing protein [Anaerolineales bacterium]|nr:DUF429 domain-containing protein [Anaerolineales bacterium]